MLEVLNMAEKEHNEMEENDSLQHDEEQSDDVQVSQEETNEHKEVSETDSEIEEQSEDTTEEKDEENKLSALQEENNDLKEEIDSLKDRYIRLQAEFDNYRKRSEKERIAARKYEAQALATELLPVIDNFERALQTEVDESNRGFYDGVKMVYEQFLQAMASQGVEVMDVVNKPFDPNLHHAVMQEEDDSIESNIVTEELQKGYMLKDKVIRPAMVKVNK